MGAELIRYAIAIIGAVSLVYLVMAAGWAARVLSHRAARRHWLDLSFDAHGLLVPVYVWQLWAKTTKVRLPRRSVWRGRRYSGLNALLNPMLTQDAASNLTQTGSKLDFGHFGER